MLSNSQEVELLAKSFAEHDSESSPYDNVALGMVGMLDATQSQPQLHSTVSEITENATAESWFDVASYATTQEIAQQLTNIKQDQQHSSSSS